FIAVVAGVVLTIAAHSERRTAARLIVPIVTYYFTFINVVLFMYDRFLLGACVILALFGGYAFARFTRRPAGSGWRTIAVAAMFAYTIVYSGTVDALMLTDSRYAAERWLDANVRPDDTVAMSSVATYMPRLWRFDGTEVYDRERFEDM